MKHLLLASLAVALLYGGCSSSSSNNDGGTDTDTDTGTAYDPQCLGMDDFTLCERVTDPDLDYDICISEHCTTPGWTCPDNHVDP